MSGLLIEAMNIEEAEHPFYVVRYSVKNNDQEVMNSVGRYVAGKDGAKVQFLEPDMRKMLKMGLDKELEQPLQEVISEVIKEKVRAYLKEQSS